MIFLANGKKGLVAKLCSVNATIAARKCDCDLANVSGGGLMKSVALLGAGAILQKAHGDYYLGKQDDESFFWKFVEKSGSTLSGFYKLIDSK